MDQTVDTDRDYSLVGPNAQRAVDRGLASATWYRTDISRKDLKKLMERRDGPAIRDTIIWLGLLIGFAAAAIVLWPSGWAIPFLLAYGVLYGSSGDSRWHECGHGTAFKTRWMNQAVYQIGSFMIMRNPVVWRRSHLRHHHDTLIVGRDHEIAVMRPPRLARNILNYIGVFDAWNGMRLMVKYAFGSLGEEEETYTPPSERPEAIRIARIWLAIYLATIGAAVWFQSVLPLLLVGTPRLYGAWHGVLMGVLQHGGLAENVLDHRLNSRTVYINPISRFIYWNMNYHIEHHMFPMVPYHALPRLHELIKHDLPAPNTGILDGYREVAPAVWRQLKEPGYFLRRPLPSTARPYLDGIQPAGTA